MNILCTYWNKDNFYKENDPEEILYEHKITVVHNHEDMMLMLRDGDFDIVLCDLCYPTNKQDYDDIGPYGATFAMKQDIPEYRTHYKIKGLGIFIPEWSSEGFHDTSTEDQFVVVAANRCYTKQNERDWLKLFNAVKFRMERGQIS